MNVYIYERVTPDNKTKLIYILAHTEQEAFNIVYEKYPSLTPDCLVSTVSEPTVFYTTGVQ